MAIISTVIVFSLRKEQACFFLDENGTARICYEKLAYFNNDRKAKNRFADFTREVSNQGGMLDDLVVFSEQLRSDYDLSKVRNYFSWVSLDSLVYVINGDKFSVILLKKTADANRALYLDMTESKFYFAYDKPDKYLPVIIGWVNGLYKGGINISNKYYFQGYKNKKCLFQKSNVILYTEKATFDSKKSNNIVSCDFGKYKLMRKENGWKVVRSDALNQPQQGRILDNMMQFMKWIAN